MRYALLTLRAAVRGEEPPPLPPAPDPARIENADEYAGTYQVGGSTLSVESEGERLLLVDGAERVVLERESGDRFLVPHPDLGLFHLAFEREDGVVTQAAHGPRWFANERYAGPTEFAQHPEWESVVGHYRSYDPWYSNFRVLSRAGRLFLSSPFEETGDRELVPLDGSTFRVGAEEWSPSRIRFDTVIDGQATRAVFDCAPYYRTFTP